MILYEWVILEIDLLISFCILPLHFAHTLFYGIWHYSCLSLSLNVAWWWRVPALDQSAWVWILSPLLVSSVTLGKSLDLFVLVFSSFKLEIVPTDGIVVGIKWDNSMWKCLEQYLIMYLVLELNKCKLSSLFH